MTESTPDQTIGNVEGDVNTGGAPTEETPEETPETEPAGDGDSQSDADGDGDADAESAGVGG